MLDLAKLEEEFEIVHPKSETDPRFVDVKFYTVPLPSEASFRIYEAAKKKGGKVDAKFISDTFVRVVKRWEGITRNGIDLECTEENKRDFINSPHTSKLAQYVMDQTDEMARDIHGIEDN
jgi:hypothetical protein